ncbi:hypothetical protein [Streptomyces sp. NPDC060194]|uniref:hypothetical protein n=1 Tax=Streptomyces sp. NPDC060194 TaxID=3347069 RepID=UPI003665B862
MCDDLTRRSWWRHGAIRLAAGAGGTQNPFEMLANLAVVVLILAVIHWSGKRNK